MALNDRIRKFWLGVTATDEAADAGGASIPHDDSSWSPVTLAVNALATAQGAGVVVYRTKVDMLADTGRPTGTGAWVLIDPDPAANTSYIWNGNAWTVSFDRLTFALGNGSGFQQAGAHAELRSIQDKLRELSLSPTDFSNPSIANGSAPADASLLAAIEQANTTGRQITIPAGQYKLAGNTTFPIDLGRFSLVGEGDVTFDCSAFTGSNVFQVYSSAKYPVAAYKNTKHRFAGITLIGGKVAGRHGILVGHDDHGYAGQIHLENVAVARFDRNHHYTNNAWRIAWRSCTFIDAMTWLAIAPKGLKNAGEVIYYDHCQFSDGDGDIQWACDSWQVDMVGCSILNTTMFVAGQGVTVNVFGGNIENPNATAFYEYINISSDGCRISLFGTRLIMNKPTLFVDAPFKVAAQSTLQFIGVTWPDGAYRFEEKSGIHAFCSGDGMVVARESTHHPKSGGNRAALSLTANALRNGDFEEGSLAGWVQNPAKNLADGHAAIETSSPHRGRYFCRLVSAQGSDMSASQKVPCRPGDLVVASAHARLVNRGQGAEHGTLSIRFLDALGEALPNQGYASNISNSETDWTVKGYALMHQAPSGAAQVELAISARQGAVVDFDDVILNIG